MVKHVVCIAGRWLVVVVAGCVLLFGRAAVAEEAADTNGAQRVAVEELPAPVAGDVKQVSFTPQQLADLAREQQMAFAAGIEEIRRSGIVERAIHVGDKAIEFELPENNGTKLRLAELWAVGPVVLVFYRGGWCPYCNQHLHELQQVIEDIHAQNAQLVVVSPETQARGLITQSKDKLVFPVLSDQGNAVARRYGIAYRVPAQVIPHYSALVDFRQTNGDGSYELPLAATYVIDTGGIVRYAFLDADFARRADPQKILEVLRGLKQPTARQTAARQ